MDHHYPMLARYVIPDMPSADDLVPYLRHIDESRWYSNFGPLATRFEQRLTEQLFSANSAGPVSLTALTSCYHALQIGLQLFRLPADARVLVPAVTFPACPLAIRHAGAEPVLADVDATTWQLTPEIARRVAEKMPIHAVMPVAVYGVPVPTETWDRFTEETGIPVIIDAAAALGVQNIPRSALVAFSLHATKPFSIGEGGILASCDRSKIDEARHISNFGTQMRITLQDGVNAKISEYHGAVALAQLDRWQAIKERRKATFTLYKKHITASGLDVAFQSNIEHAIVSALMLRIKRSSGEAIARVFNERGIAAHRMYLPPLYSHPHFANLTVVNREGKCLPPTSPTQEKVALMTNSEAMHHSVFGVPSHAFLGEADIAHVVRVLAEIIATS